jgi:hypothetical protein
MCGQTADWNNRRATPSAKDEGRERKRDDRVARRRVSKKTMAFVMVLAALARPVFPRRSNAGQYPAFDPHLLTLTGQCPHDSHVAFDGLGRPFGHSDVSSQRHNI